MDEVFSIEKYIPSDLDRIMEIEVASFSEPWSRQSYEELASLDTIDIWVAKSSGKIVGYILFQHIAGDMELHTFAVDVGYRIKGIGQLLIEHMISKAKEYGTKRIFLQVRPTNDPAKNLYLKLGFVPVAVRKNYYQDNGEDAVVMRLVLS